MSKLFAQHLPKLLRKITIRHRLFASFIVLSLSPLLVSGYISYIESSKAIQQKTRLFTIEIVKQIAKNVQLRMTEIDTTSEALVLSDSVQSALAHYALDNPVEKGRARTVLTKILLDNYGSFQDFGQKYFLDRQHHILDPQVFGQLSQKVTDFSIHAQPKKSRPYWGALELWDGQKTIAMLRHIYFKNNNQLAGSLFLGVRSARFYSIFDNVNLGAGSDVFVIDTRDGNTLIQNRDHPSNTGVSILLLDKINSGISNKQTTDFIAYTEAGVDGHPTVPYFAAYTLIPNTSWCVVSILPNNLLLEETHAVLHEIILIGLVCFFCALILAYLIARSISMPLEKLVGVMQGTETGNYALRVDYEGTDELALLSKKFNEMASNIAQAYEQLETRVAERTHDLAEANLKLSVMSQTDSLTGIANRRRFDDVLAMELNRAARATQSLALMMIDVDFFKNYNDFYGHLEGDACLRKVASILQSHARRASDLVARYGGEEFVILAVDTNASTAITLAETIRQSLESLRLPHKKSPSGHVSISIGVAVLPPGERQTAEMFIRMADQAMYKAKEQGRNQVILHREEPILDI